MLLRSTMFLAQYISKKVTCKQFCTLPKEYAEKRAEYWRQEYERDALVDLNKFSEQEKTIYLAHKDAINKGHFTYDDPVTKCRIWTTYRHFLKGSCCGEACRHCIYNYVSVPADIKEKKIFNGSFWIDNRPADNPLKIMKKLFKLIKVKRK